MDDRTFRLASTDGPLGKKRGAQAIATAANRTYEISPVRKARRGTTGRFATIEREGVAWYRPWRISTSTDLPLSVALLHWHLLMGDWRPESQATGGG